MLGQALVPSSGPAQRPTGSHGHEFPTGRIYKPGTLYKEQLKGNFTRVVFGFVCNDVRPAPLTPTFVRQEPSKILTMIHTL